MRELLQRAADGEDIDLILLEEFANCQIEAVE